MSEPPLAADAPLFERPRLRGVFHKWAFFASVVLGALLVTFAPSAEARVATAIYAVAMCGLFGVSALYHRVAWRPAARRWMRRLDHSMIFVLIAGTYTPFGMLVLEGTLAVVVLCIVWGGAVAGVVMKLIWIDAPKWLVAAAYVALGWVAVPAMPELGSR
ncbi:MAG: hemolysin III family protein, partial [Actinomycetota bacterium]|nr:hemolysin III family protein [Actinomycetota bacterium]